MKNHGEEHEVLPERQALMDPAPLWTHCISTLSLNQARYRVRIAGSAPPIPCATIVGVTRTVAADPPQLRQAEPLGSPHAPHPPQNRNGKAVLRSGRQQTARRDRFQLTRSSRVTISVDEIAVEKVRGFARRGSPIHLLFQKALQSYGRTTGLRCHHSPSNSRESHDSIPLPDPPGLPEQKPDMRRSRNRCSAPTRCRACHVSRNRSPPSGRQAGSAERS